MDDRLSSKSRAAATEFKTTVVWPRTDTQTTSPTTEETEFRMAAPKSVEDKVVEMTYRTSSTGPGMPAKADRAGRRICCPPMGDRGVQVVGVRVRSCAASSGML